MLHRRKGVHSRLLLPQRLGLRERCHKCGHVHYDATGVQRRLRVRGGFHLRDAGAVRQRELLRRRRRGDHAVSCGRVRWFYDAVDIGVLGAVHCWVLLPPRVRLRQRRHGRGHVQHLSEVVHSGLLVWYELGYRYERGPVHRRVLLPCSIRVRERRHGRGHVFDGPQDVQRGLRVRHGFLFRNAGAVWQRELLRCGSWHGHAVSRGLIRWLYDTLVVGLHRSLFARILLPARVRVPERRHGRGHVRRVPKDVQRGVLVRCGCKERHRVWKWWHVHSRILLSFILRVCERRHGRGHVRHGAQDVQRGLRVRRGFGQRHTGAVRERELLCCGRRGCYAVSRGLVRRYRDTHVTGVHGAVHCWLLLSSRIRVREWCQQCGHVHDVAAGMQRGLRVRRGLLYRDAGAMRQRELLRGGCGRDHAVPRGLVRWVHDADDVCLHGPVQRRVLLPSRVRVPQRRQQCGYVHDDAPGVQCGLRVCRGLGQRDPGSMW